MNWNSPDHNYEIQILKNMLNIFEAHTQREEDFTDNDKHFVGELSRWVQTRPTQCYGYDVKTKCGRPTVPERNGNRRMGSVCFECREKHWQKNPPPLSKTEQRTIDKVESLYKELLPNSSLTKQDMKDFHKGLNIYTKRIDKKDYMQFHHQKIAAKYGPQLDAIMEKDDG